MKRLVTSLLTVSLTCSLALASANASFATSKPSLAIGDSVMLGAKSALQKVGVTHVDAVVGRQSQDAGSLLATFGNALPTNVIVNLGANGPFTLYHCRQIVEAVGVQRHLYLLTVKVPRAWEQQSNRAIHECAATYPQRVTLVDWNVVANRHPTWFGQDGFHLDAAGAQAYAKLIATALNSRM